MPYGHLLAQIAPYKDKVFMCPLDETEISMLEKSLGSQFPGHFREFLLIFGLRQDLVPDIFDKEREFVDLYNWLPGKYRRKFGPTGR